MRVRGSWMCAVAVVGAAVIGGCASTPTEVMKYEAASQMQMKADKSSDVQMKARNYTDAIAKYDEYIHQYEADYKPGVKGVPAELVPLATYNIALCYRGLGKKTEALAAYDMVMNKYPGTKAYEYAKAEKSELDKMELKPLPAPMPPAAPAKPAPMTPMKSSSGMMPAK